MRTEPAQLCSKVLCIITMSQRLADVCRLMMQSIPGTIESTVLCCFSRKTPVSPTLSAQEGELDNLLAEPSGGWDDHPQPRGYNKKASMHLGSDIAGQTGQGVGPATAKLQQTWTEGRTMEELEREEAELAKMDEPGPPPERDEFGDFEQAP